jgi:hypothetical protein
MAHVRRQGWDAKDEEIRMVRYGLPKAKAKEIAEVYWHCRCVLRVHSRWENSRGYADWMRKGGIRLT